MTLLKFFIFQNIYKWSIYFFIVKKAIKFSWLSEIDNCGIINQWNFTYNKL